MSTSGLSPPGAASYDSGSMFVGDGTWDASENTFLLPNLQGLNYATMRYNGMGNRFKDLPGYYNMVVAHGVLAAITFLFIVPAAIMVQRFHWQNYYWKMRLHIWAQILTVLLTTAVFILGFFQVGPRRSLTNPHHSIGVALYVMILVQFIGGYLNHKRSKTRSHDRRSLRKVLHQWLGRLIGLLGVVQVALGLTLFGSPLSLFILYAVAVFLLVLVYFIFDYVNETTDHYEQHEHGSHVSGSAGPNPEKHGHGGSFLKWLLAGGVLAALFNRFRKRKEHDSDYASDVYSENPSRVASGHAGWEHHHSGRPQQPSYVSGDSYSDYDEKHHAKKHTWRDRLLGLGALGGVGWFLNRRRKAREGLPDDAGSSYYYSDTSGGGTMSRVEEGRPMTPTTPNRPTAYSAHTPNSEERLTRPMGHRPSYSDMSESSYMSGSPSKYKPRHPVRDGIMGLGALGAVKGLFDWRKRKERKEQERIQDMRRQDAEDVFLQRKTSKKYTGDRPGRESHHSRTHSSTGSALPSAAAAAAPTTTAAAAAAVTSTPGPYGNNAGYPQAPGMPPMMSGAIPNSQVSFALPPTIHGPGSPAYPPTTSRPSTAGGPPRGDAGGFGPGAAAATGLAAGAAGAALAGRERPSRDNSRVRPSQEGSPATPVSVKLNVHSDGRHVTLRRLTEEEAAKERENKRTRNRDRRNRVGSGGEGSVMSDAPASPDPRWRRQESGASPLGAPQPPYAASSAAPSAAGASPNHPAGPRPPPGNVATSGTASPSSHRPGVYPGAGLGQSNAGPAGMSTTSLQPPPSIGTLPGRRPSGTGLGSHPGSVASPGTFDTTTDTQVSQMSNPAENRRRRRAQRAQANLARQRSEGVDFD